MEVCRSRLHDAHSELQLSQHLVAMVRLLEVSMFVDGQGVHRRTCCIARGHFEMTVDMTSSPGPNCPNTSPCKLEFSDRIKTCIDSLSWWSLHFVSVSFSAIACAHAPLCVSPS